MLRAEIDPPTADNFPANADNSSVVEAVVPITWLLRCDMLAIIST